MNNKLSRNATHGTRTSIYLFGTHAASAALSNPMRKIKRVLVTRNFSFPSPLRGEGQGGSDYATWAKRATIIEPQKLESMLPPGSVHQGIVVECEPLAQPSLQQWLAGRGEDVRVWSNGEEKSSPSPSPHLPTSPYRPILLLDQISDPHNVGAILRSAAAFDVGCVIATDRNAPAESGVMAKAASGALEIVPLVTVVNLVQAIELIKKAGYWIAGLDGAAGQTIAEAKLDARTALVLGAEGTGLRRLTAEHCDFLVKLPMSGRMESLNVSNAAAVALYDIFRRCHAC